MGSSAACEAHDLFFRLRGPKAVRRGYRPSSITTRRRSQYTMTYMRRGSSTPSPPHLGPEHKKDGHRLGAFGATSPGKRWIGPSDEGPPRNPSLSTGDRMPQVASEAGRSWHFHARRFIVLPGKCLLFWKWTTPRTPDLFPYLLAYGSLAVCGKTPRTA